MIDFPPTCVSCCKLKPHTETDSDVNLHRVAEVLNCPDKLEGMSQCKDGVYDFYK